MQKKIFKSEKGSITLFVLLAILFFLIVIFSLFMNSSNKNRIQLAELDKIKSQYEEPLNDIDNIYEETLNLYGNIDNIPPTDTAPTATSTTTTIKVTNKQVDNESGIKTIEYSIYKNGSWSSWQSSDTFTNLTNNTSYQVRTRVTDKAGNSTISVATDIRTLKTIAMIDKNEYPSLANAVESASTSGTITIKMVNNTTENVTFPKGKTIILNLNGKTITGKTTNSGTLTINGNGTMQNTNANAIINNNNLTIQNGTIKATNNTTQNVQVILNKGDLVMTGGNVLGYAKSGEVYAIQNNSNMDFRGGKISLEEGKGSAMINSSSNKSFKMSNGTISSTQYGLVVSAGTAYTTGGTVTTGTNTNNALLLRNSAKGEFISTKFINRGSGNAVSNETGNANNLIIRSRDTNYGLSGTVNGMVIATTNVSSGQSYEKVTLYNSGSQYVTFPTWTNKNNQDDIDWIRSQNSSGTHTVTINKSNHNNETGKYFVDIYQTNSSWVAQKMIGGITLTF